MGMRKARCGWCGKKRQYDTLHSYKAGARVSFPCSLCLHRKVVEAFIIQLFESIANFFALQVKHNYENR